MTYTQILKMEIIIISFKYCMEANDIERRTWKARIIEGKGEFTIISRYATNA